MLPPIFLQNSVLRAQLRSMLEANVASTALSTTGEENGPVTPASPPLDSAEPIDIVVSLNEINDRHGTGPLVKRVFRSDRNVYSVRSRDDWGVQEFGRWNCRIAQQGCSRPECFRNVLSVFAGKKVRNVLCVPFLIDEIMTSIALKESFDARLCAWIMDDQNVVAKVIPDEVMREFLEKSSLRLVTHPELRAAYERKYQLRFYILPAVVPNALVTDEVRVPLSRVGSRRGALLGSFWDQTWFDRLCSVLEHCNCCLDWYGNNRSPWVKFPPEDLKRAGIQPFGVIPEKRLAQELRRYPFIVVPAGSLDDEETNEGVASLSLPGRILFAAATSHTPLLVVGSSRTCGARFVKHFGIGDVVPYDAPSLGAAMDRLSALDTQRAMRQNAAAIARRFSDRGVAEWLEASILQGGPADSRFEDAFASYNDGPDSSPCGTKAATSN